MSYQVFISSSSKDNGLAQDLAYRLQEAGAEVLSREKATTEGAAIVLDPHLEMADEVVVLLTDHSVNSNWVLFEMGAAWGQRKRLTPVIVGLEDQDLPSVVKALRYVKYGDLRKYISDLEGRVRKGQSRSVEARPRSRPKKKKTVAAKKTGTGASVRRRLATPEEA